MFITGVNDIGDGTLYRIPVSTAAGTIGTSWMSTAAELPESDSIKVSNSREDRRNSQLEH
jgi:hypothetical protein